MPEGTSTARRLRPSPSIIISVFALVIAMSSSAYAAVTIAEKNSVVSKSIKNGQVKTKDVANDAINAKKIKDGQVGSAEVADGSITSGDIGDGQVGSADIGDGQVSTADLAAGAVTGPKLAAGSVDSGKLVDGSVGLGDLAADAQSKVYYSQTKAFPGVTTSYSTFESLNLPAGKYVLYGHGLLNNNSGAAQVWDCQLLSGASVLDWLEITPLAANLAAGERESMTLMAAATLAAPATVSLQCKVDAGGGNVFWPSVTAVASHNIEVQ